MAILIDFIQEIWKRIMVGDVFGLAAQLAYFFILSLFPLLIFLVTLLPYLPITQDDLLAVIRDFAPAEALNFIEKNLHEISTRNGPLLSFGIIATLWSASNGINAILKALNRAYDVSENRPFFLAKGMSMFLTVAMIFVFVLALLLPVFGKQIGLLLFSKLSLSSEFIAAWNALRWLISPFILFVVFAGLYWVGPNIKKTEVCVIPGALFSAFGWIVVSYAFSFYVSNFNNYSATYGSIGVIIILMIWFYLTGIIVIIGGEINAYCSKKNSHRLQK
ncbi:YihY/virulence factor BrkB family protein [Bacillaceae bacterium Marseille-Q3522]|nr:YihY/virulence factor BrkB family protein [Bacillaceae bacterium Marseille-Q3522]